MSYYLRTKLKSNVIHVYILYRYVCTLYFLIYCARIYKSKNIILKNYRYFSRRTVFYESEIFKRKGKKTGEKNKYDPILCS